MKRFGFVLLVVLCLILQLSFLPALRPFGVVPDLMLVIVALVGLEGTASVALVVGVGGGIAMDLASGANFGMWTGVLALTALVTGVLHRFGIETKALVPGVAIVVVGTITSDLVILLGMASFVNSWPIGFLLRRILTELVVNLALLILMRPVVRSVSDKVVTHEPVIW